MLDYSLMKPADHKSLSRQSCPNLLDLFSNNLVSRRRRHHHHRPEVSEQRVNVGLQPRCRSRPFGRTHRRSQLGPVQAYDVHQLQWSQPHSAHHKLAVKFESHHTSQTGRTGQETGNSGQEVDAGNGRSTGRGLEWVLSLRKPVFWQRHRWQGTPSTINLFCSNWCCRKYWLYLRYSVNLHCWQFCIFKMNLHLWQSLMQT